MSDAQDKTPPDDDLEALLRQSIELQERINAARAKKQAEEEAAEARRKWLVAETEAHTEEEKREKERSKPVVIQVLFLSMDMVFFTNEYREDLIALLRETPGRQWNGTQNAVPVAQINAFLDKAELLPNVRVKISKAIEEEIKWNLTAPPWKVDVHPSRRHFLASVGPRVYNKHILSNVPGADWDESSRSWKLPLSEGWRIYKRLEKVDGVAYTEDAQNIIIAQVEKRTRLDVITKLEDTDDPRLNVLTRPVYVPEYRKEVPFRDAMKPFQRVGVLFGLEADGRILVGDDTGLGKTWQAYGICECKRLAELPTLQTIIVCKAGNVRNWVREGERLTGIEPIVCKGGKPDYFMIQKIVTERHPYVVISHDTLGTYMYLPEEEGKEEPEATYTWTNVFKASKPDCVIVDEAHAIKNPDAHRSRATRKLAFIPYVIELTASPVLNRTEELWPLLYMLDPLTFKVHDQFVNTYTWGGRAPRNVEQLHDLMKPMFIRRKKSDVQKDLPPVNRITVYHDLSDKALKTYEKVLKGVYEEMDATFDPFGEGKREMSVVSLLAQIQRLKMVCAADTTDTTVEQAQNFVENKPDGKVLIFTQYKGTCDTIRRKIGQGAVSTVRRTKAGFTSMTPTQRDELFEECRNDPDVHYIVTTAHASSGLEGHNIEFCDWVIFNDLLWTPKGHDQCEGRAYGRLSNPHPIDSVYVVADVDIVRWIMELLEKKLTIIQQAVDNIEGARDAMGSIGRELIEKMRQAMWRA